MKPLNLDHSPCNPISSNCVIWQGPDIPCIKLCKGDTITDVVYKLATELCTILDTLKVTSYDISCFNLAECKPDTFQELIQLLITRICALENIDPATVVSTTTVGSGDSSTKSLAVSNYLLTAAPCFGGGTVTLVEYVDLIAARICSIVDEIAVINIKINVLDIRVSALEDAVPPIYTTPTVTITCAIGTSPPLAAGSSPAINTLLDKFINEEWCDMKYALGTPADISAAVATQCVAGTDLALAVQYTSPGTIMQVAYPTYVAAPISLSDFINNTWIALCDLRDRVENWEKESVVAAGNNVTVSSSTAANITTYTVNALNTVIVAADDITVTPAGPVAGVTTYTIGRTPAINFYAEALTPVDIVTDPGFADLVYFQPVGYTGLTYANTSGVAKDFIVHVSYQTESSFTSAPPIGGLTNWVDGAIVKNLAVVQYENLSRPSIGFSMFDTVTNSVVTSITAETVNTFPGSDPIELTASDNSVLRETVNFFKKVNLNAAESVSLFFRSRVGSTGNLLKAQIFVQEL